MSIRSTVRPLDEPARLAALLRYEILDTAPEKEFADIVGLVKSIFNIRYAAINLIDSERQWTKAAIGLEMVQCNRRDAFCDYTIRGSGAFSVDDATTDPRFSGNVYVTGDVHLRSYLGVPLTSPDGYNIGAICVFDTVTRKFTPGEHQVLENFAKVVMSQLELRLIARQDSLTGGLTRRAFLERMDREIAYAVENDQPLSLLLLDLDRFKGINDTFGHPAGDAVLKSVSATTRANLRRGDAFGRMGGEEFAILLPESPLAGAKVFAERLRAELAAAALPAIGGASVTVSTGLSELQPRESRDAWLARTDLALYAAKSQGRNRCIAAD